MRCLLLERGVPGLRPSLLEQLTALGLDVERAPLPPPDQLAAVVAAAGPPDLVALDGDLPPEYDDAAAQLGSGAERAPDLFVGPLLVRAYAGRPEELARHLGGTSSAQDARVRERAMSAANNGVLIADALRFDFPIVFVNAGFERLSGYDRTEVLGRNCRFLQGDETEPGDVAAIAEVLAGGSAFRTVLRNYRKDGTPFWNELDLSPIRDEQGVVVQWVGVQADVTARVEAKLELRRERDVARRRAAVDPLTGLATRAALDDALDAAVDRAGATVTQVALLQLDVDRFRLVNGALGRHRADGLLRLVGATIRETAREDDLVAYLGEDQFAVLLRDDDGEAAASTAALVLAALRVPYVVEGTETIVEASVGISTYPRCASTSRELLEQSEAALHHVKDRGGGEVQAFEADLEDPAQHLAIIGGVRRALAQDELVLHYQPVFELASGRVVGAEALLRWDDPGTGLVSPGTFIPVIEDTGLIEAVGEWVIVELLRQAAAWRDEGLTPHLGFNLSPRQLRSGRCAATVREQLAAHGLPGGRLTAEVTESAAITSLARTMPALLELRALGTLIAIDDFGTGHSSLGRLRDLPFDGLKIDRTFLRHLPGDEPSTAIVRAIIDVARSLDLSVIAEGIETQAQLELLVELGCSYGQGFHLARPMPADEASTVLRSGADGNG